jgi:hypothetical protein
VGAGIGAGSASDGRIGLMNLSSAQVAARDLSCRCTGREPR